MTGSQIFTWERRKIRDHSSLLKMSVVKQESALGKRYWTNEKVCFQMKNELFLSHNFFCTFFRWPGLSYINFFSHWTRKRPGVILHKVCNPTPRIALFVRSSVGCWQNLPHHRYMHQTYMHASRSRSRIIDMCIIHTCIIVKDRGTDICIIYACIRIKDHRYIHHT